MPGTRLGERAGGEQKGVSFFANTIKSDLASPFVFFLNAEDDSKNGHVGEGMEPGGFWMGKGDNRRSS